jgi:hypothetical protein
MSIKRNIKVQWLRFLKRTNSVGDKFFPNQSLSENQKRGIKIFEKAISIKDVEIATHSSIDIIYIVVNDIYLILDGNDLEIINGKFQYYLHFNDKVRTQLKTRINNVLDERVIEIQERIKTKNDRTLDSILEDILEIKEKESIK